jgi:23S rRNA pseudouridine1911/1915/1917 synthase
MRSDFMEIEILYKDKDLLICKKPAGVASQPDATGQSDLLTALSQKYKNVSLIHRLDLPTGGVMVFGLSKKATAGLCALVQDHARFCKEYLAVLPKAPEAESGVLRDYLYHDKRVNKAFVTDGARKDSREASLEYRVLAVDGEGRALVLVRLHTGRTHQVRVQFASRGMPLLGDGKYGSREKCPYIALWAYRLVFPHPVNGKEVAAEALPTLDSAPWGEFAEFLKG